MTLGSIMQKQMSHYNYSYSVRPLLFSRIPNCYLAHCSTRSE